MHINNYERFAATTAASGGAEENNGKNGESAHAKPKGRNKKRSSAAEREESGSEIDSEEDEMMHLKSMLPLPEGVLKVNLGIPIIVVCHKVDLIGRGDKAQFLE